VAASKTNEFPSIAAFRAARRERLGSREVDYGAVWRPGRNRRSGPQWGLAYIEATGEVYAVELGGAGRVQVLGVVPADPDTRSGTAGVSDGGGPQPYYRTADCILAGWDNPAVSGHDLRWVRTRLARAATGRPPARNPVRERPPQRCQEGAETSPAKVRPPRTPPARRPPGRGSAAAF
jgi:hypothetical protein